MERILILGSGFAGIATARGLERKLRADEAAITVVGRDNFTLFTPMLPEVSAGGLETRHVVTPVRAQLKRAQYVLGDVIAIDLDAKAVDVQHSITGAKKTLAYDQLVLALGSVTSTFGIPGVAEHALPLKSLEDAERFRNRIIASLEIADVTADPLELENLADDLHVIYFYKTASMHDRDYQRPNYPQTWARMHGKGRVFYNSMGHREDVWANPKFQELAIAGLDWATGRINAEVPANITKVTPEYKTMPGDAKK